MTRVGKSEYAIREGFAAVDARIDGLRTEIDGHFNALTTELDGRFADVMQALAAAQHALAAPRRRMG